MASCRACKSRFTDTLSVADLLQPSHACTRGVVTIDEAEVAARVGRHRLERKVALPQLAQHALAGDPAGWDAKRNETRAEGKHKSQRHDPQSGEQTTPLPITTSGWKLSLLPRQKWVTVSTDSTLDSTRAITAVVMSLVVALKATISWL